MSDLEGRYRNEAPDLVDKMAELDRRLSTLEQNPILGTGTVSIGTIVGYGANVAPTGWLKCDGSEVSRTTFIRLFNVIGTTWGTGNGSTTFNLPNLTDKTLIGAGNLYAVGATAAGTHTHTVSGNTGSSSPGSTDSGGSHTHGIPQGTDQTSQVGGTAVFTVSHQSHTHGGTNSGGSHTHSVSGTHAHTSATTDATAAIPPYGAAIWIIRF